jgi:hypothetical protein
VRRSKYAAVPTTIDNVRFSSKKEAARYLELKMLQKAGEIHGLELQPKFQLYVGKVGERIERGDKPVCSYIADFRYREGPKGVLIIEDVKGMKTPVYRLKKKMVEAQYGIEIREV